MASAQSRNVHLLQGFSSPFSQDVSDEEIIDITAKVEKALALTVEEQNNIMSKRQEIESFGYGATDFLAHAKNLGTEKDLSEFRSFVEMSKAPVADFFLSLDNYIQDYLDVAMALGYHSARNQIADLKKVGIDAAPLEATYLLLEKYKNQYLENKNQYQQPKDTLRTTPYKRFFRTLKVLAIKMEALNGVKQSTSILERIRGLGRIAVAVLKIGPSIVGLLTSVATAQQPGSEGVPLSKAIFKVIKKVGEVKGKNVIVEGSENLPQKNDLDIVNIFVASHREGFNDLATVEGLNEKNMVFFGAANNFIPNFLNKLFELKNKIIGRLNKNLGFIVVGKGADPAPIEKALLIVKESPVRNFLIFPGGRLPEGFGATMGVREKFFSEEGLIAAFERAGYKINLVPLAFPDNARLFDNSMTLYESESSDLRVQVYPTIDDHTRRLITQYGGPDALGLLLRFGLTESLPTNETLVWGQVRAEKLIPTIDRFLQTKFIDKTFCSQRMSGF